MDEIELLKKKTELAEMVNIMPMKIRENLNTAHIGLIGAAFILDTPEQRMRTKVIIEQSILQIENAKKDFQDLLEAIEKKEAST